MPVGLRRACSAAFPSSFRRRRRSRSGARCSVSRGAGYPTLLAACWRALGARKPPHKEPASKPEESDCQSAARVLRIEVNGLHRIGAKLRARPDSKGSQQSWVIPLSLTGKLSRAEAYGFSGRGATTAARDEATTHIASEQPKPKRTARVVAKKLGPSARLQRHNLGAHSRPREPVKEIRAAQLMALIKSSCLAVSVLLPLPPASRANDDGGKDDAAVARRSNGWSVLRN